MLTGEEKGPLTGTMGMRWLTVLWRPLAVKDWGWDRHRPCQGPSAKSAGTADLKVRRLWKENI